jgi:hypothetical protein
MLRITWIKLGLGMIVGVHQPDCDDVAFNVFVTIDPHFLESLPTASC